MNRITYDVGFARIEELAGQIQDDPGLQNEATTRIQFVDRIFFDCLGWSRDEADLEDYENGDYADYVLDSHVRRLIVEAKRIGTTFELPEGLERIGQLGALYGLGGALKSALVQATDYAFQRGVPFAAICNGRQIVAFLASRLDGVSHREGRALIFDSPAEMVEDFDLLWQTLSPDGCTARRLARILGGTGNPPPPKLSEGIHDYPGIAQATEVQYTLASLHVLFLPDFVRDDQDEKKFLEQCYSPPGAFSKLTMLNKSVLRTRYSLALGNELKVGLDEAVTKDGLNPKLRDEVAASTAGRDPLVLLGNVGVGKTMFLRRLLRVEAGEIADDAVLLYINLGRSAVLDEDIRSYITNSFRTQLYERYQIDIDASEFLRGTYHSEVVRFARGINADLLESDPDEFRRREIDYLISLSQNTEEHLRRSLGHLVTLRKQQIIVVLDNVDQRDRADQEQVFLIAESIAKTWPCTVFVTLRPETFNLSVAQGALSGYQPRVFTVQPPRVEKVVAKRLEFGERSFEAEGSLPQWLGWTADSEDLRVYLGVLHKSFTRSDPLQRALVNLSGGNARRALQLMTRFMHSPHGDHRRTLDRNQKGDYLIPSHVFLRAVLLGEGDLYEPLGSGIPNLFDISGPDAREHFLLPCMLSLFSRAAEREGEGYAALDDVFSIFQENGFEVGQIEFALQRAMFGDLVEVLPPEAELAEVKSIRLTSVGVYASQTLTSDFQYLDAVIVDTPVTDPDFRSELRAVRALQPRIERAQAFVGYLDNAWERAELDDLQLFGWSTHSRIASDALSSLFDRAISS